MNFKQRKILKLLNDYPGKRYSELYKYFSEEDKFPYHLKFLMGKGYIKKKDNRYYVTHEGSAISVNWIDSDYGELKHKIPRIIFICKYQDKFLIKQYYQNVFEKEQLWGLPGIKVPFGQKDLNNLIKEKLKDKYKTIGEHKFRCIQNVLFENEDKKVIFDFVYLIFDVEVKEVLGEVDRFKYMTLNEIELLPFASISPVLNDFILNNINDSFSERLTKI